MMAVSMRMVVVLPAPSGPTRPKISPSATFSVRSSTAARSPNRLRQVFRADHFKDEG